MKGLFMSNKFLLSLSLAALSFASTNVLADTSSSTKQPSFTGLDSKIQESGDDLLEILKPLEAEQQVLALHFFAPLNEEVSQGLGAGLADIVGDNPFIPEFITKLIQEVLPKVTEEYILKVEAKFLKHNPNPTEEQENKFYENLQEKVFDLLAYVNTKLYAKFYNYIAQDNSDKLMVMFNKDGFIQPEDRTEALPKPE